MTVPRSTAILLTINKGEKMCVRQIILIACIAIFLSACTTTPKLHLIQSSGVSMELEKPASYVFSVIFSPDSKYALSASLDNIATIWDLKSGERTGLIEVMSGEVPGVSNLLISSDGRYLLTGMKGGGWVKLWDARTWQAIRDIPGHSWTEYMEAFAFCSDSKYAISGGSYRIIKWDVETGKELSNITHASFTDRNQSYAIAFSRTVIMRSSRESVTLVFGILGQGKGYGFMAQIQEVKGGVVVV